MELLILNPFESNKIDELKQKPVRLIRLEFTKSKNLGSCFLIFTDDKNAKEELQLKFKKRGVLKSNTRDDALPILYYDVSSGNEVINLSEYNFCYLKFKPAFKELIGNGIEPTEKSVRLFYE